MVLQRLPVVLQRLRGASLPQADLPEVGADRALPAGQPERLEARQCLPQRPLGLVVAGAAACRTPSPSCPARCSREIPAEVGDAFAAKAGFDPRKQRGAYPYFRIVPLQVQAWREVNELAERDLMIDGRWLSAPDTDR
ncbi:hypothetical protein [Nonomuraea sp. LPB2021202275-12-8]|uniref:hypothetical protein n=1 Tax=Nonomuraea sp. LPB2021202275-12-8 TaxID=3120159 RepID=UPI003FA5A858